MEELNIQDLKIAAKQVHNLAIEKGWWDKPRRLQALVELIHSELAEVTEEVRKGSEAIYYVDGKPQGIAAEFADVAIRILDLCTSSRVEKPEVRNAWMVGPNSGKGIVAVENFEFPTTALVGIVDADWRLAEIYNLRKSVEYCFSSLDFDVDATAPIRHVAYACLNFTGYNILEAMKIKHKYNSTRTKRHGGKLA